MLTKDDVRDSVQYLLRERAEEQLRAKRPEVYDGWVPPRTDPNTGTTVPGYWMGAEEEKRATYRLLQAQVGYHTAAQNAWTDTPEHQQALTLAEAHVKVAERALDDARAFSERAIAGRREQLINRRVRKLFLNAYAKARNINWHLYDPTIPDDLRRYTQRQLAKGPMAPTSLVYLYLLIQNTRQHGEDMQTEAITGYDHLASNPLAVASLDIDIAEDSPSAQQRAYIRELQLQSIRDRQPTVHENKDPRDALADFEYHGMADQMGAMWITKDDTCTRCKQGVRLRIVHSANGYRLAVVCPNYRTNTSCHYDAVSPVMHTRKEVRDWATVEWAMEAAA